jgi:hypothetical protein
MRLRQRPRERDDRPGGDSPPEAGGGSDTQRLRQAGDQFFAAAENAINRALSGDSERFNRATRQEGGE